jgi:hypothetical protein
MLSPWLSSRARKLNLPQLNFMPSLPSFGECFYFRANIALAPTLEA